MSTGSNQIQATIVQDLWQQIEKTLDAEKELSLFKDYHSGVQYNEMAIRHDLKEGTVATRIRKIKTKLRVALEAERF